MLNIEIILIQAKFLSNVKDNVSIEMDHWHPIDFSGLQFLSEAHLYQVSPNILPLSSTMLYLLNSFFLFYKDQANPLNDVQYLFSINSPYLKSAPNHNGQPRMSTIFFKK